MISWHRFKRDIPAFLDKLVEEKKEGLVPINMVRQLDRYEEQPKETVIETPLQPFVSELSEQDILDLEKNIQKSGVKEKKVKKPLDKKKKNS